VTVSLHLRPGKRARTPGRETTLLLPSTAEAASREKKTPVCQFPPLKQNASNFHSCSSVALLPPERAALGEPRLAARGLAQHLRAARAHDHGLCVAEDGGDGEAAGALDVHEEAARAGDERLLGRWSDPSYHPREVDLSDLELMAAGFGGGGRVEEVDGENLGRSAGVVCAPPASAAGVEGSYHFVGGIGECKRWVWEFGCRRVARGGWRGVVVVDIWLVSVLVA